MVAAYNRKNNDKISSDYKIIYNGNDDFIIDKGTIKANKYYNLTTEQMLKDNKSELKNKYNRISKKIIDNTPSNSSNLLSESLAAAGTTRYVTKANYNDLVDMDDFAGKTLNGQTVDNHCSPTAGTNLVKYWARERGVPKLYYMSDWWVFSSLCVNMKTKFNQPNAGTTSANFLSGLRNYSSSTRGVSYSGYDWWGDSPSESCTFDKAKSIIDMDVPFHLDLDRHSMACFGYSTASGYNQLIVNTGWNKSWTFQSFTSFAIDYYQYVRGN